MPWQLARYWNAECLQKERKKKSALLFTFIFLNILFLIQTWFICLKMAKVVFICNFIVRLSWQVLELIFLMYLVPSSTGAMVIHLHQDTVSNKLHNNRSGDYVL